MVGAGTMLVSCRMPLPTVIGGRVGNTRRNAVGEAPFRRRSLDRSRVWLWLRREHRMLFDEWEVDPNWRPKPSAYGTGIESEIRRANDLAGEAQARIAELGRVGVGPGPFAGESIRREGP